MVVGAGLGGLAGDARRRRGLVPSLSVREYVVGYGIELCSQGIAATAHPSL